MPMQDYLQRYGNLFPSRRDPLMSRGISPVQQAPSGALQQVANSPSGRGEERGVLHGMEGQSPQMGPTREAAGMGPPGSQGREQGQPQGRSPQRGVSGGISDEAVREAVPDPEVLFDRVRNSSEEERQAATRTMEDMGVDIEQNYQDTVQQYMDRFAPEEDKEQPKLSKDEKAMLMMEFGMRLASAGSQDRGLGSAFGEAGMGTLQSYRQMMGQKGQDQARRRERAQQTYDRAHRAGMSAVERAQAQRDLEAANRGGDGQWSIAGVDEEGNTTLLNQRTGETKAAPQIRGPAGGSGGQTDFTRRFDMATRMFMDQGKSEEEARQQARRYVLTNEGEGLSPSQIADIRQDAFEYLDENDYDFKDLGRDEQAEQVDQFVNDVFRVPTQQGSGAPSGGGQQGALQGQGAQDQEVAQFEEWLSGFEDGASFEGPGGTTLRKQGNRVVDEQGKQYVIVGNELVEMPQ